MKLYIAMVAMPIILGIAVIQPALARSTTCKDKVEIAVEGKLGAPEAYDVTARLITKRVEWDGNTQLWKVKVDSGVDGGGASYVYAVTTGEGQAACILKGIFDADRN